MRALAFHPQIAGLAAALLGAPRVRMWHDQALYKEAGGRETDAHQDHAYWPIEGLDALTELTTPMEATYSPGGYGKLKLSVTPTWLSAGTLGGNPINQQRFGSNALELASNGTTPVFKGIAPGDQSAQGVGLDLGYTIGSLTADAGVTPLGLREQSVLGGVEYAPALTDNLRLRLTAERRAVTDSLLAYGGAVDPRSGETWGGVTRDHAKANLELTEGLANFYLGGGGETLSGAHVASNTEYEFGAGGNVPVWRDATAEIRAGLDLVYFGYAKNLRYFSLGQGGYFSPQSYMAALIPVTYKDKVSENLSYEIGGSAGFQDYRENASAYFPDDPALQAQLVAQQANPGTAVTGLLTQYPSDKASGFTGNAHAAIDYRVSTNLHLGGRFDYEHSGNFDDASGVVYAKYVFSSTGK